MLLFLTLPFPEFLIRMLLSWQKTYQQHQCRFSFFPQVLSLPSAFKPKRNQIQCICPVQLESIKTEKHISTILISYVLLYF